MEINISGRKIDLTQSLNSSIPAWEKSCGFKSHITVDYDQGCRAQKLEIAAGIGTHIDAPAHFIPNGQDIASLSLEKLIVLARVIDLSANLDPDYLASPEDIIEHEKKYGKIPENNLIIFHTTWSRYWFDVKKYRNEDKNGTMHFPGISPDTAELLINRNIAGIGIDTLSPDGGNTEFPVHHLLLEQDKYIIENMANTDLLPPIGSIVIALPLKIEGGTESPARVVGLVV